jgi:D-alanyl-D-alanine carboxypeptidase/D-alanyl-D-alanine-endopeptidase (penicillin-binding protein 4)
MVLPASLTKLYTAGSSMMRLGTDRSFRTEVQSYGQLGLDGTLNGSLVLVGGGDPTLIKIDLQALAAAIYAAGVRNVSGDLYADDSRFDRARGAPGWKSTYFPDDIGSLSALAVDGNVWRTDPAFYADPATGNLELFRALLAEHGVAVAGVNKLGRPDGNSSATLGAHDSAPLGVLLADMLRTSDNFYAELILKELGRTAGGPTSADGAGVLRSAANELGVGHGQFVDGSGLSLDNRESPVNIVEWLKAVERISVGDFLKKSLPTPCSGTKYLLEKRLCGTSAAGKVQAKTGTLAKTRAVAGYTTTASGRKVWMALVLNDVKSTRSAWEAFDRVLIAITSFTR